MVRSKIVRSATAKARSGNKNLSLQRVAVPPPLTSGNIKALIIAVHEVNCEESSFNRGHSLQKNCPLCRIPGGGAPPCCDSSKGSNLPGSGVIRRPCCGGAATDYLQSDQFENVFSNRNSLEEVRKILFN